MYTHHFACDAVLCEIFISLCARLAMLMQSRLLAIRLEFFMEFKLIRLHIVGDFLCVVLHLKANRNVG